MMTFSLGGHKVGGDRVFVIAEIGNNHNGSLERAIEMIDLVRKMGADCAKFQMRHLDEVYRQRSLSKDGEDLGTEYVLDLLRRFELSVQDQSRLAKYCSEIGITYMCTPWDIRSANELEAIGVPGFKLASADLTNLPLIDRLCRTGKPIIASTGMSTSEEVRVSADFLRARGADFAFLHCNSTYPAPLHDINLRWLDDLKLIHPIVGYSGHERGTAVTIAAVARGATIIERHFTLDRQMEGPDHAASLEFAEFGKLVEGIREVEQALGSGGERPVSQGEMINRENLAKSLVAASSLRAGVVLGPEHISVRSPGQGLSPQRYDDLVGRTLKRDMGEEDFFFPSDISSRTVKPRPYRFRRPWGVPVRYHDFKEYDEKISPDFYEFHLSYSDMDLDPSEYLSGQYEAGLVVHAPELFSGSHLMDLVTPDTAYRNRSIEETQRVIDITRSLKSYFPSSPRPPIVANIGGFSMDAPISRDLKVEYYQRFAESLSALDLEGVEFTPQTMAPFPWHFGGQRYQNLFVHANEIVEWCHKLDLRMCFDVSHSFLTANHFNLDFYDFAEMVAPLTAHLHLGDARGVNGEGLQISQGDLDFHRLGEILDRLCPDATFLPEIWQGHKNHGEGFWIALEALEEWL